jgi:hypothetical protein
VGANKHTRKKLASEVSFIEVHRNKISAELDKDQPDFGLIEHWESEIRGHLKIIERLKKRLPGGR